MILLFPLQDEPFSGPLEKLLLTEEFEQRMDFPPFFAGVSSPSSCEWTEACARCGLVREEGDLTDDMVWWRDEFNVQHGAWQSVCKDSVCLRLRNVWRS